MSDGYGGYGDGGGGAAPASPPSAASAARESPTVSPQGEYGAPVPPAPPSTPSPSDAAPAPSALPQEAQPATASLAAYILSIDNGLSDPCFYLRGTGHHRLMAERTGFVLERATGRYVAPSAYHARLLWHFADDEAHQALKKFFPLFDRPDRPLHTPYMVAASDRLICLTSRENGARARLAGFNWNGDGHFWQTQDLRKAMILADIAEPDLKVRFDTLAGQPLNQLGDVSIRELIGYIPKGSSNGSNGGGGGEEDPKAPILVEYDHNKGVFKSRNHAAYRAGFKPAGRGEFVSQDFEQVQTLRDFLDEHAEMRMQAAAVNLLVPDPNATDPRPVPRSPVAPYDFGPDQLEGINFAATRRGCFIGDEMGVGKTAQVLGLVNLEQPELAMVLAPANLLDNWMQEAAQWLAPPNKAAIFGRGEDRTTIPANSNVLLASYDMLPALPALHHLRPSILCCDEAQKIKSEFTNAGRIIYGQLAPAAGKFVPMSGTPIWNRPQDLWAPLHAIAPEVFPNRKNFMKLYKVDDPNPDAMSELQKQRIDFLSCLLKSGLMIRRLKDAVMKLPPKEHTVWEVPVSSEDLAHLRQKSAEVEEIETAAAAARGQNVVRQQATLMKEMNRLRQEVGEAKLPYVREKALEFLRAHGGASGNRPLVIFGRHRHLLRALHEALEAAGWKGILLTGASTTSRRQKMVNDFQAGKIDFAIASFDAAGVGYTMTRSRDMMVYELDYTPALMKQAIDRVHRRGQTRVCNILWCAVPNTIDARMATLFTQKDGLAQTALGDHIVGMYEQTLLYKHPALLLQEAA